MDEKHSLGKRLRLSWVCIDVAPLMPLGFFLKFAISVKAHREVWDFAFRTWERLDFEGIHTITLNVCNNTKLIFFNFWHHVLFDPHLGDTPFFHLSDAQLWSFGGEGMYFLML